MTQAELAAGILARNLEMIKMTLGDFSDADMLVRPTPAANHAAWQLGHLALAEANLVNRFKPGAVPAASPEFAKKFSKETARVDDPGAFPKKAELIDGFTQTREATIRWVKGLSPADMDTPGPEEMRRFAGTIGELLFMTPVHAAMHLGQFQVIRRKLGKPVLF